MRNTIILLSIIMLALAVTAHAQPDSLWSRTYGGTSPDECFSMIQTADGGYALAGYTYSFGIRGGDMWLVKTDEDGDSLWSRTFGGREYENCKSIIQTTDGGYALAGYTRSFGAGEDDMWLVKTDEDGDSLWSQTFGGQSTDACYSIIQTADGGYALAGYTNSFGAGSSDMWLVKTNEDGDSLWSQTFGGDTTDMCYSIIQTVDGGYVLAGYTRSFGAGYYDMWLVKIDADGDSLWSRTFGGEDLDKCYSVIQTADGGYALAGWTNSFDVGNTDNWLVKTDAEGDSLWSQTLGGGGDEWCHSIIQTADGGYALAGGIDPMGSGGGYWCMWLVKANADGDSLWSRIFAGSYLASCNSLIQTADECYVLAGSRGGPFLDQSNMWLVKTDPDPVSVPPESFIPHPSIFILSPAYPNPFNSTASIRYGLPYPTHVLLQIYNPSGQRMGTLFEGFQHPGIHITTLKASCLPSGLYFVRLKAAGELFTQKVMLVR